MPASAMWSPQTIQIVRAACEEDLDQCGDITSALLKDPDVEVSARLTARQDGTLCGLALAPQICDVFAARLNRGLEVTVQAPYQDRAPVEAGACVATVHGTRAAILAVERTLLNFVGRMSGVATLTRRFVETARKGNPQIRILDTRKTIPGWRELDKYAVRCGGGDNHRTGLYDAILIKDNHLAGIPTEHLANAVFELLNRNTLAVKFVEVEVDNLAQLAQVLKVVGVDVVLLDNFTPEELRRAVIQRDSEGLRGKVALEASGGVTLENVAEIATSGIDRISVGALTHSAASLDIGLDL